MFCIVLISGCVEQPQPPHDYVDLDIDSDNNNMFSEPDRSLDEEEREEVSKPGRVVVMNDDDNDGDQVPDFADGFNLDSVWDNDDDINPTQQFVPLLVEISSEIDLEQARIRVTYDASNPADTVIVQEEPLVYEPAPGALRIWAQPGDMERNPEQIADGGDFVAPSEYSPEQLGLTNRNRMVTWYVEGIQTSRNLADQEIIIEVDAKKGMSKDVVRVTVIDFQFKTQGPDGGPVDQEFTYNSVPAPQINATVEECQIDESGLVTMIISGIVSDQTSGIVSDPELQLRNITLSSQNQITSTIDLDNVAEPEYPWQPYKFQSSFSATVQFQTHPVQEEYLVFLRTAENPAGVAAELNLFVFFNGEGVYCVGGAETDPGTYIPTIMRVDAPEGTFMQGEDTIYAFDKEWPLKYRDIGDGEYFYAMDSQDKVKVFLPALYAEQYMQEYAIAPIDQSLLARLMINHYLIAERINTKIYGLMIQKDDITANLGKITNYATQVFNWGNVKTYVYRPRTGWAGHLDDSLDTEIKYRYINHADTISGNFKSKAQFEAMVEIRKNIVKSARDVHSWGKYWQSTTHWTKYATVKSGYTASEAIAHAFDHQTEYGMGCYMAAILVMERGWCLHHAWGFNMVVGSNPFGWKPGKLYSKVITREGRPATGGCILLKDKVKWIPGDWGYIINPDPKAWEVVCTNCGHKWTVLYGASKTCPKCGSPGKMQGFLQGENIIYLGGPDQGPGKPAIGNFELLDENKFKNSAYFWGHILPREMTLRQWFDDVNKWSSQKAKIKDFRDRIKY